MIQINANEYIDSRLDDQISWYDKKAKLNKNWHIGLSILTIVASSSIAIISGFFEHNLKEFIIAMLGTLTSVSTGIGSIYKFSDNWSSYRTISESLKHQKYLFLTGTDPYSGADAFAKFVHQCEGLISEQNNKWAQALEARRSDPRIRTTN